MPRKKEDWYTNIKGAAEILDCHHATVGKRIKDGLINGDMWIGNSRLVAMSDIAGMLGTSENVVVRVAKEKRIPLWKCK